MDVKTQTFLVLGISKSGKASAEYILEKNGKCFVYDDSGNGKANDSISELVIKGAIKCDKESVDTVLDKTDVIIISPGVPINHEIAVKNYKRVGVRFFTVFSDGYRRYGN